MKYIHITKNICIALFYSSSGKLQRENILQQNIHLFLKAFLKSLEKTELYLYTTLYKFVGQ